MTATGEIGANRRMMGMNTVDRPDSIGTQLLPQGRRARRIARWLPVVAVLAWVAMIWVPVLDSGNDDGPRLLITSLGEYPISPENFDIAFALPWAAILLCAVTAWFSRSLTLWSPAAVILGLVLLVALVAMVMDPPFFMWDGQDEQGRWVGGMEVGYPAPGAVLWALGSAALIAGGIFGLVGSRHCRHRRHAEKFYGSRF